MNRYSGPLEDLLNEGADTDRSAKHLNVSATLTCVDSADVGADVEVVEQYAIPARQGTPSVAEIGLYVAPGSTAAVIWFRRPVADLSCQVTLYSSMARVTSAEHADTKTEENRLTRAPRR